ncbi:hypothetical protein WUBG_00197 [Wuchereria bancrofti]|uniref:Peptidase S54 rhomboid domain-containing protein n=1 Tax=Wuchereria bancrofti TaxID=6293 RepID=J9FGV9_WUCBA|nr:hypothetical protein WUBG_00197 [Wuchereria bancrofti]
MSGVPDRSHLSLPLKNITTRDDSIAPKVANTDSRPMQQKLMKSFSTPADYFVPIPEDLHFPSSSSNSLKGSGSYPPLSRAQSIRDTISNGTAKFFGVPPSENCQSSVGVSVDQKWSCRRLRFICRHYGNPKEDIFARELRLQSIDNDNADVASVLDDLTDVPLPSKSVTPQSEIHEAVFLTSEIGAVRTFCRSKSVESRGSRLAQQHLERRDSVIKMVYDEISSIVQRGTLRPKKGCATVKRGRSVSSSFAPFSVQQAGNITHIKIGSRAIDTPVVNSMPAVVEFAIESHQLNCPVINFPSEVETAVHVALSREIIGQKKPLLCSELTKYDIPVAPVVKPQVQAQTVTNREAMGYLKGSAPFSSTESIQDEVFFDYTLPTVSSNISGTDQEEQANSLNMHRCQEFGVGRFPSVARYKKFCSEDDPVESDMGNPCEDGSPERKMQPHYSEEEWLQNIQTAGEEMTKRTVETCRSVRKRLLLDTIYSELKSRKYSVAHRRRFGSGFGIWRKYFQRAYKKDVYQLNDDTYIDCRPFFTYWITTVQILVTIISLYTYGIGPWGFGLMERTADVLHTTVILKRVSIYAQQNIWLGPKFADLVHLGAKFTPCMRMDPRIFEQIEADRKEENETGCCIYNDGAGCFQTGRNTCPSLIATLAKWKKNKPGPEGRTSGAVCGQDPRYCDDPVSVKPYEWPDDITQWPICKQMAFLVPENVVHMQCEITGRPCCIQLHGQCRITTRDYCDFVEGYFHENATLCSQVSCLSEICGMLPFLRKDRPDQWYRLFIPLFLHAGIIHCILTVFIQILYMRDLEKLLGWARVALLYMVSGIGGYLAGAIFVPYRPEVGPAGSHVGMFAAMYVDVLYSWNLLERPWHAVVQLSLFTLALFAIGTLPWVDNWAHLFGFIFGILISLAVLPYIQTKRHNRTRRIIIVVTSLSTALSLFVVLLAVFYWPSGFSCVYCEYFNCIPYTDHFCDNQGLRLKNWLPI